MHEAPAMRSPGEGFIVDNLTLLEQLNYYALFFLAHLKYLISIFFCFH